MSKKTLKDSVSQNLKTEKSPDLIAFTTADKLPDFDTNFTTDFDPQNEAKKRSTQSIYNRSIKPASADLKEVQKPSVEKKVLNRSINQHQQTRKTAKKTECEKRSTQSIYKPASADPKKSEKPAKKSSVEKEVLNQSKLPNTSKHSKEVQDLLEQYKRSTHSHTLDSAYLSIITLLKNGLRPSEIATESGVSKTTLQRHLNHLKKQGIIHKVGYGVWDVIDTPEITKKRSTQSIYVAKNTPPSEVQQNLHMFIPDSVRAHAFLFTLQVPKNLRNWNNKKREQYLDRHNIPYKSLGIINGGQRLIINGRKTHLTDKSIVIYDRSSYFAEKAIEAKSNAVHSFISIIKKLERTLHVELTSGSDYKFRVSRQHYALVKNALAQQYNAEGAKLEVRSEGDNSLWFLIDNSFNLDEAEAVHPKTGMTDAKSIQDFFNGVKETRITPAFILKAMAGIQGNQAVFAENTKSHIEAIQDLSDGVKTFNSLLEKLFQKLEGGDHP